MSPRSAGLAIAAIALISIIAVNVVVIVRAASSPEAAPEPAASAEPQAPSSAAPAASAPPEALADSDETDPPDADADGELAAPKPLKAARFGRYLRPLVEGALSLIPREPDPAPPSDEGPRRDPPGRSLTVHQASSAGCSTSSVDGLSRQIIAQARCIAPKAFVSVPARPNLVTGSHVFLYLAESARDRLLKVLDEHRDRTMTVNSALRTVAQQYLLWRWSSTKRCGIQLATPPGESNHETGLALDIAEVAAWRATLEAQDFKWLGAIDKVHFDYKGPLSGHHPNVDVLAFQKLWNRNHPEDTISETGVYNAATEVRLKKSPARGFAKGAACEKPQTGGGGRVWAR